MKKILFATSALVATGLFAGTAQAAEPIKLSVGGFMQYYYAYASESGDIKKASGNDSYGIHTKQNNEVHFSGSTTLDNGIKVDAKIELEGTGGSNTDQVYVKFGGDFGQVTLGQAGSAGASMHVSPPSSGFIGADDGSFGDFLQKPNMNENSGPDTYPGYISGSHRKITYMSPSFSGVTFGASYTPNVSDDYKQKNNLSNNKKSHHNGVSLALAYGGEFSGMSLAASLGYERIERSKNSVGVKTAGKMTTRDSEAALLAAGISLGFDAFTVGAAYGAREDAGDSNKELESFSVGVGYEMGDASVSFGYAAGKLKGMTDPATGKKSTEKNNTSTDVFDVGMDYKVSPGIKWQSSVTFVSFDGDKKYKTDKTKATAGNSWVVGTGLALSF